MATNISPMAAAVQVRHPIKAATLLYSAPPFVLRGPIYMMFVTMVAMLVYSFIATTDTLVRSPVKLERQSIPIPAIGGGRVEDILVKENSTVRFDSPLAIIQENYRAALTPEQEALYRQQEDLNKRKDEARRNASFRTSQLENQIAELRARASTGNLTQRNRVEQLENQLRTAQASLPGRQAQAATARQSRDRLEPLCRDRIVPITQCEAARTAFDGAEQGVRATEAEISNAKASLDSARAELRQQGDQSAIQRLEAEKAKADEDLKQETGRLDKQIDDILRRISQSYTLVPGVTPLKDEQGQPTGKVRYSSTVDEGVITTVHAQTGQLINPGQPIVTIVRNNAPLVARLLVQNRDIGQLKRGRQVQIKYDAYPYQEYGISTGQVSDISVRPNEQNLYPVKVALDRETIQRQPVSPENPPKALEIGLSGVAEIKVGDRRFIEMLFAPASKFFKQDELEQAPATAATANGPGAAAAKP